ncbi:MAG TPA: hypothetical protein VGN48_07645 [Pedococcus sp.]|nr:hypothetical protein [Pedococcus sp.]
MNADRPSPPWVGWALRVVIAAGLGVDAVIHLQLAAQYQLAAPGGIGQGNLFRIQAIAAALAALWVLVRGGRRAAWSAAAIAASALAAVMLYRYVDIPAIGPLPAMYEPLWFAQKTATAVAEAVAVLAAVVDLLRHRPIRTPG